STGYNLELPDCFVQPFELTAKYMQLEFKGCEYLAVQTESDLGKVTVIAAQAIENVT
ncbi:FMN reductase, partial [Vibrio parahaemolyticus]